MLQPKFAALIAFAISVILVIVKGLAWFFSGSSTVLASFTDSIQDSILSATNFLAIRYAMQPADDHHRYGHGKMEGIAALGQAAFILGSCIYIFLDSIRNFSNAETVEYPFMTIGVIVFAIVLNGGLVTYQKLVIKTSKSLAIEADSAVGGPASPAPEPASMLVGRALSRLAAMGSRGSTPGPTTSCRSPSRSPASRAGAWRDSRALPA